MNLSTEQVANLSALLGVESIDSPETLLSAAETVVNELRTDNVAFLNERDAAVTELSAANAKIVELSAAKPGDTIELSAASKGQVQDRIELARAKLDRLADRGDLPIALSRKLAEVFVNDADPDLVLLSRDEGTQKSRIDMLVDIFDGAKLGMKSEGPKAGVQELSRAKPKDDPNEIDPEDLPYKRMAQRFNGSAK